jgi:hypothetical protein
MLPSGNMSLERRSEFIGKDPGDHGHRNSMDPYLDRDLSFCPSALRLQIECLPMLGTEPVLTSSRWKGLSSKIGS